MIGTVVLDSVVMSVAPDSKFKSIEDLIAYGKEHPGEIKAASTGTMGYNQVSLEMIYKTLGIEVTYVPYENASKAKAAVMGGHADIFHCYLSGAVILLKTVKSGRLRSEGQSGLLSCLTFLHYRNWAMTLPGASTEAS